MKDAINTLSNQINSGEFTGQELEEMMEELNILVEMEEG
jgi:flagellar basal body P-ring protein FlgI